MRLTCYELSSDTDGAVMRVSEGRFDSLLGARRRYDLFVAIRGELCWAHKRDVAGQSVAATAQRADLLPIVNLARADAWMTPSQLAGDLDKAVPAAAAADLVDAESPRKHFEKGRRAVDVCLERRGRRGVWRSIVAGPKAANGEPTYRFHPGTAAQAEGLDVAPIRYCIAWAVAEPERLVFAPAPGHEDVLPVADPLRILAQHSDGALKITVRDAVINAYTDELVLLVDLRSEAGSGLVFFSRCAAELQGVRLEEEAPYEGARIVAPRFDVTRWSLRTGGATRELRPGHAVHFVCLAFDARPVMQRLKGRRKVRAMLRVWRDTYTELQAVVPVRLGGRV